MRAALSLVGTFILTLPICAQTLPQTRTIPVPALVEVKSGEIAYDLSANDFTIKDQGIEQKVKLDEADSAPHSLILVIQTGRNASLQRDKIDHLDSLLDTIVTSPADQIGVLTFDSRPHVLQKLTADSNAVSHTLGNIPSGDQGAAMFDALNAAVAMFSQAPAENRRVILLISGEHDHGSLASSTAPLIRSISLANVTVYSLTFGAPKREFLGKLWSMNPLAMTAGAMSRNAAEALAQLTGGDFYRFGSEKNFDDHIGEMANHIHNSYWLSFQPDDPAPGFHSLQVGVRRARTTIVAARSGYWIPAAGEAESQ
ncbi:MAG TPA: VWA domain-containing protein [Acidobacteriaceae bacterium]|nr:VWA domain-containing protein [Acidobacteriaceae bacterium]